EVSTSHLRVLITAPLSSALLGSFPPVAHAAPLHVNCDTGGNLQNKIMAAPRGSTILVKGTCDGPFTVTGKGLTLRGDPSATLDGQGAGSTLTVDADGKTVHLTDLRVTGGLASGQGGGVNVLAGNLTMLRAT